VTSGARDTRKHPRMNIEVAVMISDAAKRVRKPIRFSSGDISGGGAFLRSDLLFEVGETLMMEFDLPGGRHIRTQGRVVRVARGGAKDRFPGMGLEFIDLSPDDRAAIARLT
jgi:c-di-GMP-binding flagellar brake protein YcgR